MEIHHGSLGPLILLQLIFSQAVVSEKLGKCSEDWTVCIYMVQSLVSRQNKTGKYSFYKYIRTLGFILKTHATGNYMVYCGVGVRASSNQIIPWGLPSQTTSQ